MAEKEPPRKWWWAGTWLPVVGLALLLGGAWRLMPRGDDPLLSEFGSPDVSLPTVVVDAGHGGKDGGAVGNGLREKDLTLDTALRLERQLRRRGFPVVMTRRDDTFLELGERAMIANKIPRALFVSVHFNANTSVKGEGVETFYAEKKEPTEDSGWSLAGMFKRRPERAPEDQGAGFAHAVQANVVAGLGAVDRGAKPRQLAVVRWTRCPAVLVEGGFINNPAEAKKVAEESYREQLAAAVAAGVAEYHAQQAVMAEAARLVKVE